MSPRNREAMLEILRIIVQLAIFLLFNTYIERVTNLPDSSYRDPFLIVDMETSKDQSWTT
jgi:hypothetical protein